MPRRGAVVTPGAPVCHPREPTKVERVSMQNAASIAGLLLTTDAAIVEIKEKKAKSGGGHSHGGMDDMDY